MATNIPASLQAHDIPTAKNKLQSVAFTAVKILVVSFWIDYTHTVPVHLYKKGAGVC
jgi:hypothetical protein